MAKRSVTIIAAWITGGCIVAAAIIAGLFQYTAVKQTESSTAEETVSTSTESIDTPNDSIASPDPEQVVSKDKPLTLVSLSFLEYFEQLKMLRDRNFERDQFIKNLIGAKVVWQGFVDGATKNDYGINLSICAHEDLSKAYYAFVMFKPSWETQLFALRNGDLVQIEAIYRGGPTLMPNLDGLSLSAKDIGVKH